MDRVRAANGTAVASLIALIALIALCVAWEWRLAPLRPGGSMLVLKALPLLVPLRGMLRGSRYTHQWTSFLSLAYFMEGTVRAMSESGARRWLAATEIVLALVLFAAAIGYARLTSGIGER